MARTDKLKYGSNTIGTPTQSGRGWFRVDRYESNSGAIFAERHFAAGRDDDSPLYMDGENGRRYDTKCSCCWLNFSHTEAKHDQSIAKAREDALNGPIVSTGPMPQLP